MKNIFVRHFLNLQELSLAAAEFICRAARNCRQDKRLFTLVLSGGKTPRLLFQCLASDPIKNLMPWASTHLFWADERCVPPDDTDSNFALAFELLISKVPLPQENIHRMQAEVMPPEQAARLYEKMLKDFFMSNVTPCATQTEPFPCFDLVLLGVGRDGHTASLFPGNSALKEKNRWVVAVHPLKAVPSVARITLTLPVFNHANRILFLASGREKKEVIQAIVYDRKADKTRYPATTVQGKRETLWYVYDG